MSTKSFSESLPSPPMQFGGWDWLIFLLGGFAAGVINTLAGNGSAITITLLLTTGMDATVANATNRVAVLVQTATSLTAMKRSVRTYKLVKDSVWYFLPMILGSIAGALLAVDIPPKILEYIIGFIMIGLLFTLTLKPKRWLISTDTLHSKKTLLNWLLIFLVGLYGGFIQMGIGIMILAILVLYARYSLKDGNIIKLVLAFVMIVPAFFIYLFGGDIQWLPGIALAVGTSLGAWFGMRKVIYHPRANGWIRKVLIVVILFALVRIFGGGLF